MRQDGTSTVPIIIHSKQKNKIIVSTDLSIQLRLGTYGRIAGRSGFATNYHVNVAAGVIDRRKKQLQT